MFRDKYTHKCGVFIIFYEKNQKPQSRFWLKIIKDKYKPRCGFL